jgi:hypothetical protein
VVQIGESTPSDRGAGLVALLTEDDRPSRELHLHGFTLAEPVLDILSELLVEIVREERDGEAGASVVAGVGPDA